MAGTRRSPRSASTFYNTNGRDYLASEFEYTHQQLETWLKSGTVRPHLQLWYKLCIVGGRRYQEALAWISEGCHVDKVGYFYDAGMLQEDVLFFCLAEGNIDTCSGYEISIYANPHVETHNWSTQEVWARSAWRIVQENAAPGGVFETMVLEHPVRAYALVIDLMSIAFHSIAFRRTESVWEELIGFHAALSPESINNTAGETTRNKMVIYLASQLDKDPNAYLKEGGKGGESEEAREDEVDAKLETSSVTDSESSPILDDNEDEDFNYPSTPMRKAPSANSSPKTPKKSKWRALEEEGDEIVVKARSVARWMDRMATTPEPIRRQRVRLDRA